MSDAVLVVFIDAYPYWALNQGSKLRSLFPTISAVRPGFGYSINCQTELFTGMTPDQVGYWCEYSYEPGRGIVRNGSLGALDALRSWRIPNRACHKVVDRFLRKPTKDIPFSYLQYFRKTGKELFSPDFPFPTILKLEAVRAFSYFDFPRLPTPEARDKAIFDCGIHAAHDPHIRGIVVALGNLDRAGHWHHPGGDAYSDARDLIERRTVELMQIFEFHHPGGHVILISDHGMSPVNNTIHLELERHFGLPSMRRYVYFVEGTILRVWSPDPAILREIRSYLHSFNEVEVLTSEERRRLGVANTSFGDLIAVTNDGVMWVPSFWGAVPSKGMHGHHPRVEKQLGIFLSNKSLVDCPTVLDARDVAAILNASMSEDGLPHRPVLSQCTL